MNEIIQKLIPLPNLKRMNEAILREMDLKDLIDHSKIYRPILDSFDIICIVTNSGASNLGRTKRLYSQLAQKVEKADFYIIANFQDLTKTSYEPEKVEEFFDVKTFGFSAIHESAKEKMYSLFNKMIRISITEKIQSKQT
ncbi:MAG: hypothetical protein KAW66_05020 [Candidatus Lokiarchaeota archaeon]|nr:hypothetical protein [Candidatus Lokiarchaeota archaeon]